MLKMANLFVNVFVIWIFCTNYVLMEEPGNREETTDGKTPVFSPDERYQDLFPLTNENFTKNLLRNRDPWILIFHDGSVEKEWKTMATHLRGLCWFGLVDVTAEKDLLDTLEYDSSRDLARFYPYGDRKMKERNWRRVNNQNEARVAVLTSLPDKTQRISGDSIRDLLLESFTSLPSKFPAYIITDEDETPSVFKAIAKRFEKYFLFGRLVRPTSEDLHSLGLKGVYINPPELFVIVTKNGEADQIEAIRFEEEKFGKMNYTSILQFLFVINGNFRHDLPGNNMAQNQQEAEMADVIQIEERRFEILRDVKERSKEKPTVEEDSNGFNIKISKHVGFKDEL
ncbi:uncharacterized protein LOC132741002 [Ruditapes philippinarum]|uniref:uncharacterized protein LOC132741002 n=1 Tax=Ruditapes philippinarum TaxID=129788 RepID=UPI00295B435D|nr:uncharacterized protein LOC132741002 [Ruditapes philippinarum]